MTFILYTAAFIGFWFFVVPAALNFLAPKQPWMRSKA